MTPAEAARATLTAAAFAGLAAAAACGSPRLATGLRLEAAGRAGDAAAEYAACYRDTHELACGVHLAQLYAPTAPARSCARFLALVDELEARHGRDEAFVGPHARELLTPPYDTEYPVDSVAEWCGRGVKACRALAVDHAETEAYRRGQVLQSPCARVRPEEVDTMDAARGAELAARCDELRRLFATDAGADRALDEALARALVVGALAAVDEAAAADCDRPALAPLCPTHAELAARVERRAVWLARETAPPTERLRWARYYLKRWPRGPHASGMRAIREHAQLDAALQQSPGRRATALDDFVREYPESPLRARALRAVWEEAEQVDTADFYEGVVRRYPDSELTDLARAMVAEKRSGHRRRR